MALLILCPTRDPAPWVTAIKNIDPTIDLRVWPDEGDKDQIDFVLVWLHPPAALAAYTNLKGISSMGAGIDFILNDPTIPHNVLVARLVDPELIQSMSEYIVLAVLNYFRRFDEFKKHQAQKKWQQLDAPRVWDITIGVMGLGQLGADAAKKLTYLGFNVNGWSLTLKNITGIKSYYGENQFETFLSTTNVLICLLPLTSKTQNILNRTTFKKLPSGAYIINAARGDHLVEEDLLEFIENGHLSGACLDVFREEPLPDNHPFWENPKIIITPHISSLTDPVSVAPQIVENYKRAKSGKQLLNQVDLDREY